VLAQTWENWDYTILDNCSTDGSSEIAQRLGRRDSRIRVVAADRFRSQAANFNQVLSLISPESVYTKMVLSDDWLSPDCLEQLVEVAEESPSVGLVGGFMMWDTLVACQGLPYPSRRVVGRELARRCLLSGATVFGTPTSVMYRSEVVRNLQPFFDETSLSIDTDVCYRILKCRDFGFAHRVLSFCRTDNDSITSGIITFNPYLLHSLLLLERHGPEFLSPAELDSGRDRLTREYFNFLGESVLRGREPGFWAYHARGLALLGYRLDGGHRLRWAASALLDLIGNPKRTLERLADRRQRRAAAPVAGEPVQRAEGRVLPR
jgi:glycosyltransferase involved in cell wall biosynthesis